jgi:hypothetical protein
MPEPKPVRGILCRHTAGWIKTDEDGVPVESVSRCVVCNRHATREDIEQWKQRVRDIRLRAASIAL